MTDSSLIPEKDFEISWSFSRFTKLLWFLFFGHPAQVIINEAKNITMIKKDFTEQLENVKLIENASFSKHIWPGVFVFCCVESDQTRNLLIGGQVRLRNEFQKSVR